MTKPERIIAAYNCVNDKLPDKRCEKCPYGYGYLDQSGDNYVVSCNTDMMFDDAISLLRAQEHLHDVVRCAECKYWSCADEVDGVKYGDCNNPKAIISRYAMPNENYYCADGERRESE